MAKKKKEDIFFIVSKSGEKKPHVNFYDQRGESVPKEDLNVRYRNSVTGRFVTQKYYSQKDFADTRISRPGHSTRESHVYKKDSLSGQLSVRRNDIRSPQSSVVERIPKNSPLHFERDEKKRKK